jgi:hypothetical protein
MEEAQDDQGSSKEKVGYRWKEVRRQAVMENLDSSATAASNVSAADPRKVSDERALEEAR